MTGDPSVQESGGKSAAMASRGLRGKDPKLNI